MDKKDQIILQQLDVIRTMTENGLRRMNTDFWGGTPFESVGKTPTAPDAPKAEAPKTRAADAKTEEPQPEEQLPSIDEQVQANQQTTAMLFTAVRQWLDEN